MVAACELAQPFEVHPVCLREKNWMPSQLAPPLFPFHALFPSLFLVPFLFPSPPVLSALLPSLLSPVLPPVF